MYCYNIKEISTLIFFVGVLPVFLMLQFIDISFQLNGNSFIYLFIFYSV